MGSRVITRSFKPGRVPRPGETRALAITVAAIVLPLLLTGGLISLDMRTDLSGLKARPNLTPTAGKVFGWEDLDALEPGSPTQAIMLGYMMDGRHPVPDDTPVGSFMLMPEAGHLLHPAHREPEAMVEVWLPLDLPIRYHDRRLIEVSGMLLKRDGRRTPGDAGYTMANAVVRFASDRRIREWFLPGFVN